MRQSSGKSYVRLQVTSVTGQRGFELSIPSKLDDWLRANGFEAGLVVLAIGLWLVS